MACPRYSMLERWQMETWIEGKNVDDGSESGWREFLGIFIFKLNYWHCSRFSSPPKWEELLPV